MSWRAFNFCACSVAMFLGFKAKVYIVVRNEFTLGSTFFIRRLLVYICGDFMLWIGTTFIITYN